MQRSYAIEPTTVIRTNDVVLAPTVRTSNVVLDSKRIFSEDILKECYETHDDLTESEIEWASRESSTIVLEDPDIDGRWPDLVLLILHTCKCLETGKLSFIYNFEIDDAISRRDEDKLRRLIKINPDDIWQEKTRNDLLTKVEQAVLTEKRDKEIITIMNVVAQGKTIKPPYLDNFIIPTRSVDKETLYNKCYRGVCIEEANQSRRNKIINKCNFDVCERIDTSFVDIVSPDLSPDIIMINMPTSDQSDFIESETRCYEFDVILEALTKDPVYDPLTKEIVPPEIANVLKDKYSTEIKIYKYYLNYLDSI